MPRIPNPWNLLTLLALFLALGGTTYAAAKIGGADVRNGSLTGADIRNGSLTEKEFSPGTLRAGGTGAPGADGAPGATGEKGERGADGARAEAAPAATEVVRRVDTEPLELQVDPFVSRLELDAGRWAVTVTGELANEGTVASARCSLALAGGESVAQDVRLAEEGAPGESAALALNGVVEGPADLTCSSSGVRVLLEDLSMTAIRVGGA